MKLKFSSIAGKRFKRFKSVRRSYYSLIILVILYSISLCAEFIANDKPLIVKSNGRLFFPVFKFYPESEFLENGEKTEADYKKIAASDEFRKNQADFILFPLIQFGPNEIEKKEHGLKNEMEIKISKKNMLTGIIRVNQQNKIIYSRYSIYKIFERDTNDSVLNNELTDLFDKQTADSIALIINARYNQQKSGPVRFNGSTASGKIVNIRFTSFDGSKIGARGINIRINEDEINFFMKPRISIDGSLNIIKSEPLFFSFIGSKNKTGKNLRELIENSNLNDTAQIFQKISEKFKKNIIETEIMSLTSRPDVDNNIDEFELEFYKEKMKFPFKPTKRHLFGLDEAGRDILSRLIYAFRLSMTFGLILVFSAMFFGFIIGAVQGYAGGAIDIIFQRIIEIWAAIPFLYVIILLGDVIGKGFLLLLFCYAVFNWIGISYYIRAEFLKIKQFQYIEAARAIGLPWYKIIFRHILPNALTPIISFLPFSLMGAIAALSALDYLGYGLPAPAPSWGELLGQAQIHRDAWWLIVFPTVTLFITMLLTVFIGEGIREAFDHKKMINYK